MSWTMVKEDRETTIETSGGIRAWNPLATVTGKIHEKAIPPRLNIRAIIDIDNEQAELKDLIASLQKHVKED